MKFITTLLLFFCFYVVYSQRTTRDVLLNAPNSWQNEADTSNLVRNNFRAGPWTIQINEFCASNTSSQQDPFGEFDDFVEIYNYGVDTVDLDGMHMTDDFNNLTKWTVASGGLAKIPPGDFLVLWADNTISQGWDHANFTLSSQGEQLAICDDLGAVIDSVTYGQQMPDISQGREPIGGLWNFYDPPNPNLANGNSGLLAIVETPTMTPDGGFYSGNISVSISCATAGTTIYYTTDGSEPNTSSTLYTGTPLNVSSQAMIRAKAYAPNMVSSYVATNSYIYENSYNLDVVTLTTDSANLWGSTGIYDNRYNNWERDVHIEYFKTSTGQLAFELDAGIKIHAADSRPQQSLRLYARAEYGTSKIDYPIFDNYPITEFKRLVLRNSGNDGAQLNKTHIRDAFAHKVYNGIDNNYAEAKYKPVHVYLNGQYWGIYNIRERQDQYYIDEKYNWEDFDLLERSAGYTNNKHAIIGDFNQYDVVESNADLLDMSVNTNYQTVINEIDLENYCTYHNFVIWTGNKDWVSNNIKFWKPTPAGYQWKWILWDVDWGFGTWYPAHDHGFPDWNLLHYATKVNGGWSGTENTLLLRNLILNEDFKVYFCNRAADMMNYWLRTETVLPEIDYFEGLLEDDMHHQNNAWGYDTTAWKSKLDVVRNYISGRNYENRGHYMNKFALPDTHTVYLDVLPVGSGKIRVNTITPPVPWDGVYFEDIPIEIEAIANPGYTFDNWNNGFSVNQTLTADMIMDSSFTAYFNVVPIDAELVINEINYNSDASLNMGDWIEVYNPDTAAINLTGWTITDDNNTYAFPNGFQLGSEEYLVICSDTALFASTLPGITNYIGQLGFNLNSNGETISVFDNNGVLIDQTTYNDSLPWPFDANGNGPTAELIHPSNDNTLGSNWFAWPAPGGTPGAENHDFTQLNVNDIENNPLVLNIYPNPVNENSTASFIVGKTSDIQVSIYDTNGKIIEQIFNEKLAAGQYNFKLNTTGLESGIYFLEVVNGDLRSTKKLVFSN